MSDDLWCLAHGRSASECASTLTRPEIIEGTPPLTCNWQQREPVEPPEAKRWTVGCDFDGVLHLYDGVWRGADEITGPPVPGAIDWLNRTTVVFNVGIHSTRCLYPSACQAMAEWLRQNGTTDEAMKVITLTVEKPPALVYVDDRGWRFDGTNFPSEQEIHNARPWWRK